MFSPEEVETARIEMLKARKVLSDYEVLHGPDPSSERTRLVEHFYESAERYRKLSDALFQIRLSGI